MNESAHTWWETTEHLFGSLKAALTTMVTTVAVSTGAMLNALPDYIALFAIPVAFVASVVALKVQLVVLKKRQIELDILRMDRDERLARAEGTPKRRVDDQTGP